jgi:hypothetical protein
VNILPPVVQQVDANAALAKAPQSDAYVINSMKKLMCNTVFASRYLYNLHCSSVWDVQTGGSSSGDRSKIVKWILPNIMAVNGILKKKTLSRLSK